MLDSNFLKIFNIIFFLLLLIIYPIKGRRIIREHKIINEIGMLDIHLIV